MYYCCCCSFILIFLLSDSVRCKLINDVDAFHCNQTISVGTLCLAEIALYCLKEFPLFIDPCTGTYGFFQLATCSKPPIRDNHHKLSTCHLLQIRQGLFNTNISYNWEFCIALLWKSLCFFVFFVYVKLTNFLQLEIGIAITSKWLHVQS